MEKSPGIMWLDGHYPMSGGGKDEATDASGGGHQRPATTLVIRTNTLTPVLMADTADATGADAKCPVCNTDRYLNPNMVILVSPCYHKMYGACGVLSWFVRAVTRTILAGARAALAGYSRVVPSRAPCVA